MFVCPVPSGLMVKRSKTHGALVQSNRAKTILLPSGDQAGSVPSAPGMLTKPLPSALMMRTPPTHCGVEHSVRLKASFLPSGDHEGSVATPLGFAYISLSLVPSASASQRL